MTASPARAISVQRLLRRSGDGLLVALAFLHAAALFCLPALPVVALGLWWNSNTIAHNFIHRPFFRSPLLNRLFALFQTALLGIPQTLWRDRHLAHHAGRAWRPRLSRPLIVEAALVLGVWLLLLFLAPRFFLLAYAPGYAAGLALCALHGRYEHARGATISHYGRFYNRLFFNDGYHVEHHARPGLHWSELPDRRVPEAAGSRWPAVLRWLDAPALESLERLVLRFPRLQRWVVRRHERAFRKLLSGSGAVRSVGIVGGGLFPRTALILERLLPEARLVVIDASAENIDQAKEFAAGGVRFIQEFYDPGRHGGFDLLVVPLSFRGDRDAFYHAPPAPCVLVHEWLWRKRGRSAVVSLLLLKRLNRVSP